MLTSTLISLMVGMVLGQRFKVPVLLPAAALALLATIGDEAARGEGFWPTVLSAAVVVASLQLGYLAGVGIRHFLIVARASRLRTAVVAKSQPVRRAAH